MKGRWRSIGLPDQVGRRAIVTGANTGLGFAVARVLAGAGADVVLAVRDLDKGVAASLRIRHEFDEALVRVVHLDLASLASVEEFAAAQLAQGPVDLLVNNAGVMLVPRRELTEDGFERHMGVNHLGHFALTGRLLPALERSPAARVVSVTSLAARRARRLDHGLGLEGEYTPMGAYSQSKLAVGLFAVELDRRLQAAGSTVASVLAHPGWSATAVAQPDDGAGRFVVLSRRATALLGSSPAAGARSEVAAATAPGVAGGVVVGPRFGVRGTPTPRSVGRPMADTAEAAWLWDRSVELTGVRPPIGG
ncbi:SDR family NAD(P)-dependent oxidoreductase [Nakamurella sp.]|uniref:SDR family NAD(P)-dependent oxidoreductase n=1 Tax=Nakamurella sp. TaxID=1869182 RepID=UPI003B3B2881